VEINTCPVEPVPLQLLSIIPIKDSKNGDDVACRRGFSFFGRIVDWWSCNCGHLERQVNGETVHGQTVTDKEFTLISYRTSSSWAVRLFRLDFDQ